MGPVRTGRAILEVMLGDCDGVCDGVFYAGELDKWILRAGMSPLEGEERPRFWAAVRERVAEVPADESERRHMRRLERSSGLFGLRGRPAGGCESATGSSALTSCEPSSAPRGRRP